MKPSASRTAHATPSRDLYDLDFFEWTRRTARQLWARRLDEVDVEHAAEEIEDMGKRDLRELNSRMEVLVAHLLKWKLQPRKRSRSWRATITSQRREIAAVLRDSPSLRPRLVSARRTHYDGAVERAAVETGLREGAFPTDCPFSIEQILDARFLPD